MERDNKYYMKLLISCSVFLVLGFITYSIIISDFNCDKKDDTIILTHKYITSYCNLSQEDKEKILFNYHVYGFFITFILCLFFGYIMNEFIFRYYNCRLYKSTPTNFYSSSFC